MGTVRTLIRMEDGRDLDVVVSQGELDQALLFMPGRPSGAVPFPPAVEVAERHGLRYLTFARPGYARSTRLPGRTVAHLVADVRTVADRLGIHRLHVVGWSAGGPLALALGALRPDLVASVATVGMFAPHREDGIDWRRWMGSDDFARTDDRSAYDAAIAEEALGWDRTAEDVKRSAREWACPADERILVGAMAEFMAASFRDAFSTGHHGMVDDDLAHAGDWGFDLGSIRVPVSIWHGSDDTLVPLSHGRWLADQIPAARPHVLNGEGHLSIPVLHLDRIAGELLEGRSDAG